MHSKHILPLSISDYVARFGLELVVLGIAMVACLTNISVFNHAHLLSSSDQSVIFSFVKNNPNLNTPLISSLGTTTILAKSDQLISKALAQAPYSVVLASTQTDTSTYHTDPTTIQNDVVIKTNPSDTSALARHGLTTYTVNSGDTVTAIASSFGISPQTIMAENKITTDSVLKTGQELTILPTTGITYTIKDGDTLDTILNKYKISEEDFLDANNIESFDDLAVGSIVVIPLDSVTLPSTPKPVSKFVQTTTGQVPLTTAKAPEDLADSPVKFIWPTPVHTITQGFSSRHTGLDISDSQKEPIYAAADGFVEIAGYQTNGYGNTIVINHGDGFKTRYGHASELYVKAGDYVKAGQLIAKQGNTGRVRGVTGIHLHFEIILNGTRVNPLNYVQP